MSLGNILSYSYSLPTKVLSHSPGLTSSDDKIIINYCDIIRDSSLIFLMDTTNINCYNRSLGGTAINNLINTSEIGNLSGGAIFNTTTGAIDLTAASQSYIDFSGIPSFASLYNAQNATILVWVKWDPSNFLNVGSYNEGPDDGFEFQYASGAFYYGIFPLDQVNISYYSYIPNTYVQLTMTYDGTIPAANMYVNGVLLNVDVPGNILPNIPMDGSQYLTFGSFHNYSSFPFTQGSFAYAAVYNRTLSSNEVMQNYLALNGRFV